MRHFLLGALLFLTGANAQSQSVELERLFADWDTFEGQDGGLASPDDGATGSIPEFPDVSDQAYEERIEAWTDFLDRLSAVPIAGLSRDERISFTVFERNLLDRIADVEFKSYRMPFMSEGGFHTSFAWMPGSLSISTVEDAETYIDRLRTWPDHVDAQIAQMREGIATGWTQPREAIAHFDETAAAYVSSTAEESVFWNPMAGLPNAIPESERRRLQSDALEAIQEMVSPAYLRLASFFRDEYLPAARETVGASDMPGGRAYYEYLVRHYTTLDVTPEQVHEIGLGEVARIQSEMDKIILEVEFEGSFADFLDFLRTDSRFYARTPEELLSFASWISKRMDGELPNLFGRLPRRPYGVAPVPAEIAPNYTGGRYVPGGIENGSSGTYWVNTYALESRPLYVMEALSFHEAVPGHHLQIALTQELDHLPSFRRQLGLTAYEEGWALYAEGLAEEVGFYSDPYSRFGRLTYEMWRACRLVVDTGLHAFGWSRQEAIDYLASRTALSFHEVATEIDRYITWPGQALGYKMGELTIRRLRKEAEDSLGAEFDIRAFHDEVLAHGEVPMGVLEVIIREWIETHLN